ncbi:MAG: hypothetical protein A2Y66_01600 [Nitrospirae bacterium RBG_13_41_22]|nr:MAG: hypothetical protein A2Y66_01600 [Nitrospirae bacterium RBG_13_41_22]
MSWAWHKPAPARDTEFARPPREPQRRRKQNKPEPFMAHTVTAPLQKGHQGRRAEWQNFRSAEVQKTSQQVSAPRSFSGSTTRKY